MRDLGTPDAPDFHPYVLHFTDRRRGTACNDETVKAMTGYQRLLSILASTTMKAFPMYGTGLPAACFTEFTRGQADHLIAQGFYGPWAVAFSKAQLFRAGGGPVLEVRGDEWPAVDSWPDHLRARAKRLWPGATAISPPVPTDSFMAPVTVLPWYLQNRSEWSFEREWRVPVGDLAFEPEWIEFLIVNSVDDLRRLVGDLIGRGQPNIARVVNATTVYVWDTSARSLRLAEDRV